MPSELFFYVMISGFLLCCNFKRLNICNFYRKINNNGTSKIIIIMQKIYNLYYLSKNRISNSKIILDTVKTSGGNNFLYFVLHFILFMSYFYSFFYPFIFHHVKFSVLVKKSSITAQNRGYHFSALSYLKYIMITWMAFKSWLLKLILTVSCIFLLRLKYKY